MRLLKTTKEYEKALVEFERLLLRNPRKRSDEHDRMELLALIIRTYEQEHFVFDAPDPTAVRRMVMEQRGLKKESIYK